VDCPSVPSGLAASAESGTGGFFGGSGGSSTVCGCCSLRADLACVFCVLLICFFEGFSGVMTGVASGKSSAINSRPLASFSDSTHRKKASLNSSIAAHPARPKLADTAIRTSATRARARIDILVTGPSVLMSDSPSTISGGFGGCAFRSYALGVEGQVARVEG